MLMTEKKEEESLQTEFDLIIEDLVKNEMVQKMKDYRQHYDTSCFDHCKNVAYYSYLICKKYHFNYIAAARAGMLHDLFLYDWRSRQDGRKGFHAFTHPKTALKNATSLFDLTDTEVDIILKHMWPLTIRLPRYIESYIVTFVDKYCALQESFTSYHGKLNLQKLYRYSYIFLTALLIIR